MTATHLSDEQLQCHFDGELEPHERGEVLAHLSGCADCDSRLAQLGRLQNLVRMAAEDAADDADWQGMFARIERAAAEPEAPVVQQPNAAARARWFRPATMSAAGAIAIAAAVLLIIYRPESDGPTESYEEQRGSEGDLVALATHSEIMHVDYGPNAGQVFDIDFDDGSSTPVVWINDDDDVEEY